MQRLWSMTKMLSPRPPATGRVAGVRFTPIDTGTDTLDLCRPSASEEVHVALVDHRAAGGPTRSTRTADTLYSGIFDFGSSARLVSWLAAWRPAQW